MSRSTAVALGLLVIFGAAGCKSGGSSSGLFGLFGGSTGDGSITSIVENSGGGTSEAVQLAGGSAAASAATVHNPEPGSLALFGGGLLGLIATRRRKAGRKQ